MTNMSGDIAVTSVTDFFTLPNYGWVSGSTNIWTRPYFKSGRTGWKFTLMITGIV